MALYTKDPGAVLKIENKVERDGYASLGNVSSVSLVSDSIQLPFNGRLMITFLRDKKKKILFAK